MHKTITSKHEKIQNTSLSKILPFLMTIYSCTGSSSLIWSFFNLINQSESLDLSSRWKYFLSFISSLILNSRNHFFFWVFVISLSFISSSIPCPFYLNLFFFHYSCHTLNLLFWQSFIIPCCSLVILILLGVILFASMWSWTIVNDSLKLLTKKALFVLRSYSIDRCMINKN